MDGREQTIQYLTQLKRDLAAKRERLLKPVQEVDQELEGVSSTLALVLRAGVSVEKTNSGLDFPLRKLKGLTHTQALIEIAKYQGGTLRAQDAKVIMLAAGVMKPTKNATHMVHGAIARSEAFERVGRGEYRLKTAAAKTEDLNSFFEARPVQ